jgi:hypothetical protein
MATKNYQYRAQFVIVSGGYPGETTGVSPADDSWHTTDVTTGSATHTYYYNDSTCATNANSSRTSVNITDSWTVSIDEHNNMSVTVHTIINSISRAAYQGDPNACASNIVSDIIIRRQAGGTILARYNNQNFATYGTVASNVDLGTYTFTLAPGQNANRSTVHYTNDAHFTGGGQEGLYDDVFRMGITFRNILPADYRPGATLNSVWLSHDRTGGSAHILTSGGTWSEMRTVDGLTASDNPPSIYTTKWMNQRKLGKE